MIVEALVTYVVRQVICLLNRQTDGDHFSLLTFQLILDLLLALNLFPVHRFGLQLLVLGPDLADSFVIELSGLCGNDIAFEFVITGNRGLGGQHIHTLRA